MKILEKSNVIVEIDKGLSISFNKRYKSFVNEDGEEVSLDLKQVKKDITEYLEAHRNQFKNKKLFSLVYDYDNSIAVTIMKRSTEYDIYDIIGFSDIRTPEETIEDDEEAAETREQLKALKENEKNERAKELESL